MVKHLKEDSAAYLKSWLDNIKEKPDFLKSIMLDVKRSTSLITQRIDRVQEAISKGREINRAEFVANDYKPESDMKEVKAAKMPNRSSEPACVCRAITKRRKCRARLTWQKQMNKSES